MRIYKDTGLQQPIQSDLGNKTAESVGERGLDPSKIFRATENYKVALLTVI